MGTTNNRRIAQRLAEAARILEGQGASAFRVNAYRRAAETVGALTEPVEFLLDREKVPGIGDRLESAIREIVATGHFALLDHLRGEVEAEKLLAAVPGIGRVQAERLHRKMGIDTLEELEEAAHDGRLELEAALGSKRVETVIGALAVRQRRQVTAPVEELLDVDREYREAVAAGRLSRIAPRRFNPGREAWLPILHTERGGRHYTALFSNTARAHALHKTGDWVVIYDDDTGGQCTVVTSHPAGVGTSQRVVRGREGEPPAS